MRAFIIASSIISLVCVGCADDSADEQGPPAAAPPVADGPPAAAEQDVTTAKQETNKDIETTPGEPGFTKITYFGRDEGFPIYLAHLLGTKAHVFPNLVIDNPTDKTVKIELHGSLQGYTKEEAVEVFTLPPKHNTDGFVDVALDFAALGAISAPVSATFNLKLLVDGKTVSSWTKTTTLLPKNSVFWTKSGETTKDPATMSQVMASLTTPHDKWQEIDHLLQASAPYSKYKAMIGYQYQKSGRTVDQDVADAADQLGAIYTALKAKGMVYTDVSEDFFAGGQNVRFPSESLRAKTANCIDGSLVFASALESIGMAPVIIVVPGHAFAGVRAGAKDTPAYDSIVWVETTVISSKTFVEANQIALQRSKSTPVDQKMYFDIAPLRASGYLPSPLPL